MVDFGKSDKMKISGNMDKPTLTMNSIIFRSLLKTELHLKFTH